MGRACNTSAAKRNAQRLFEGMQEGKTRVGRPRCKRVDIINMDLAETVCDKASIGLAEDNDL
jgi:hypothetical protein